MYIQQANQYTPIDWVDLTTEQKTLIKTEITTDPTGRGYAGAVDDKARLQIFQQPYGCDPTTPNVPQIPLESTTYDAVFSAVNQYMNGTGIPGGAKIEALASAYQDAINAGQTPNAADPTVQLQIAAWQLVAARKAQYKEITLGLANAQTWKTALVDADLVSADTATRLLYAVQHPSRLDEILSTTNARLSNQEFAAAIA